MASSDPKKLSAAYDKALKLQNAGDDDAALAAYSAIIAANANIAEVHFQVARIFLKNDRLGRALRHIKAAATLKPGVPDVLRIWCQIVMALSDKGELAAFHDALAASGIDKRIKGELRTAAAFRGKTSISIAPMPQDQFRAIVDALNSGRPAEAEKLARAAIRRHPQVAPLHDTLSVALTLQDRAAEAAAASETAIRLAPKFPDARVNYARALIELQRAPEGVKQCNLALLLSPGLGAALLCRADCYVAMGFEDEARQDMRRAMEALPKDPRPYYKLAAMLHTKGELFEARDVLLAARAKGVMTRDMRLLLAPVLADLGETEAAVAELEDVIRDDPKAVPAWWRMAELLQTLGEFDRANAAFERAIALDPDRGQTYRVKLASQKIDPEDPLVADMDRRFNDQSLPADSRAHFGFALAKVMEDAKRYDRVFHYLRPANDMIHSIAPYDLDRRRDHDHRVMESLRSLDWQSAPANEASSFAPIFITGMPRSGTTLVEQIIASHSTVTGAGELGIATKRALKLIGDEEGRIVPAAQVGLDPYAALAAWYEGFMRRLYPDADRITDKSIQTYNWIGPLRRAMPRARFVVVRRDPRDNLLSIYKNVFPENAHLYSYDIKQLVGMYHLFLEWLDFWRELTPGWFHEIHYEKLVANPEEEARTLIAACDLEWEDGCLDFHKTERRIKTLSVYQVRQPMYQSSTKAWQRYRKDLDDLFEALGPDSADAAE